MGCPACDDVGLMRHYVSYFKPVKVDQCPSCHGTWLDDRELDTLFKDKKEMALRRSSSVGGTSSVTMYLHCSFPGYCI